MLGGIEILTVRHPAVNLISNGQCREKGRKDTSLKKNENYEDQTVKI